MKKHIATRMTPTHLAVLTGWLCVCLIACDAKGQTLLGHMEFQCFDDVYGCTSSTEPFSEVEFVAGIVNREFRIETTRLGIVRSGETSDVIDDASEPIRTYFANGMPSGLFDGSFYIALIRAGGNMNQRRVSKEEFRDGLNEVNEFWRLSADYDVPLLNGIDLRGVAEVTQVRLQVLDIALLPVPPLSNDPSYGIQSHYRVELLGKLIPEPSTFICAILLLGGYFAHGHRTIGRRN